MLNLKGPIDPLIYCKEYKQPEKLKDKTVKREVYETGRRIV